MLACHFRELLLCTTLLYAQSASLWLLLSHLIGIGAQGAGAKMLCDNKYYVLWPIDFVFPGREDHDQGHKDFNE